MELAEFAVKIGELVENISSFNIQFCSAELKQIICKHSNIAQFVAFALIRQAMRKQTEMKLCALVCNELNELAIFNQLFLKMVQAEYTLFKKNLVVSENSTNFPKDDLHSFKRSSSLYFRFVGDLYMEGVIPFEILRDFLNDLISMDSGIAKHCTFILVFVTWEQLRETLVSNAEYTTLHYLEKIMIKLRDISFSPEMASDEINDDESAEEIQISLEEYYSAEDNNEDLQNDLQIKCALTDQAQNKTELDIPKYNFGKSDVLKPQDDDKREKSIIYLDACKCMEEQEGFITAEFKNQYENKYIIPKSKKKKNKRKKKKLKESRSIEKPIIQCQNEDPNSKISISNDIVAKGLLELKVPKKSNQECSLKQNSDDKGGGGSTKKNPSNGKNNKQMQREQNIANFLKPKIENIMDFLVEDKNIMETANSLNQLCLSECGRFQIISLVFDYCLDKQTVYRNALGELLIDLTSIIAIVPLINKKLLSIFKEAKDLIIDVPHLWENLAQILSPLFCEEILSFNDIKQLTDSKECTSDLVCNLLRMLKREKGEDWVLLVAWDNTQLKLSDFIQVGSIRSYIEAYELDYLANRPCIIDTKTKKLSISVLQGILECYLNFDAIKAEGRIQKFCDAHMNPDEQYSPEFISALTMAICKISINQEDKMLNENLFKSHLNIIRHYVIADHLYSDIVKAVLSFASKELNAKKKRKKALQSQIIGILKEMNVISDLTFVLWERGYL